MRKAKLLKQQRDRDAKIMRAKQAERKKNARLMRAQQRTQG